MAVDAVGRLQGGDDFFSGGDSRASEASVVSWTTNSPMPRSIRTMVLCSRAKRRSAALSTLWM